MTPNRWQQIESVYHAALETRTEARSAALAELCGSDNDLRQEVESLLLHEPEADEFLETPCPFLPGAAPQQNSQRTNPHTAPRVIDYLLTKRALQLAAVLPVVVLAFTFVKNRNQTIAELISRNYGYFYWLAAAALGLKFRTSIRIWLERHLFRED